MDRLQEALFVYSLVRSNPVSLAAEFSRPVLSTPLPSPEPVSLPVSLPVRESEAYDAYHWNRKVS